MARNKNETTESIDDSISTEAAAAIEHTQQVIAAVDGIAKADFISAIQSITRSQIHFGYEEFSRVNRILEMKKVKEIKAYRSLKGQINPKNSEILSGTWEEYCNLLGMSVDKADIDIKNLNEFGFEALEVMDKVGIGYSQMKQLRKLPDDEKTALIEAAKTGDKNVFLDIAEEIISRNAATQESMQESIVELETNHQTQGEILAQVKEENLDLKMAIKKLKPGTKQWDAVIGELKEEITNHQSIFDEVLAHHMESVDAIDSWITQHVTSQKDYDPEAPVVIPKQAVTALLHLEDCITRSAHLIAAARSHLQNEYGAELADARRDLLTEDD